jgi:hypothetical protein
MDGGPPSWYVFEIFFISICMYGRSNRFKCMNIQWVAQNYDNWMEKVKWLHLFFNRYIFVLRIGQWYNLKNINGLNKQGTQ